MYRVVLLTFFLISVSTATFAANNNLSKEAKIFQKCAKCHGKDGRHKAFGRSEIIAGQDVTDLVESMKFYKDSKFKARGVTKVMAKLIKQLSYEEIINLAKYISKL